MKPYWQMPIRLSFVNVRMVKQMDEISQNETEIVDVDSMLKEDAEQRRKQLMRHKIPE